MSAQYAITVDDPAIEQARFVWRWIRANIAWQRRVDALASELKLAPSEAAALAERLRAEAQSTAQLEPAK